MLLHRETVRLANMCTLQIHSSKVSRDTLYEAVREVLQGSQAKPRKYEYFDIFVCVRFTTRENFFAEHQMLYYFQLLVLWYLFSQLSFAAK